MRRNAKKYKWQEDVIDYYMKKYSGNYSEVVRVLISLALISIGRHRHKHPFYSKEIECFFSGKKMKKSEMLKCLDLCHYEARKIIENIIKESPT